jgi:type VII secretion integral membrane protein EccD
MPDDRCRITVVGESRRVDLAIPARAPIAEYVPRLAELCGAAESDALPAVWSLAEAGGAPLSPGDSLAGAGVLDGATLYLWDTREGEALDLVVTDLDEQIAEAQEDDTVWSARTRALATLCAGLLVVVISAGWLGVRHPTLTSVSIAVAVFPVAALCSALIAWYSTRKVWPIPSAVRQAFALVTCPLMASAGLGEPVRGAVITPVLVCVAASVGALAGMVALPAVSTVVLMILTTITAVFTIPLVAGHAGMTASAALVGTAIFLAVSVLPWVNSRIAILVPGEHDVSGPAVDGEDVARVVGRGNRLLIFLSVLTSAVMTVCLLLLSASADPFAFGLLACVSVGLLLQATSVRLLAAVAPQLAAGTVGLIALAVRLPEVAFGMPTLGPAIALLSGLVLAGVGLTLAFSTTLRPSSIDDERPQWPASVAVLLSVASIPLTVGVFGVYDTLANLGSGL